MRVEVERVEPLRFTDGTPVTAASGLARLGDGHVVVQDDATHAALLDGRTTRPLRVLPPVEGLDRFSEAEGTKHLKPDLEAACEVPLGGSRGVLLLGSGSSPARMRAVLVGPANDVVVADLSAVYAEVARVLEVAPDLLNLEGACLVGGAGGTLRWFQRGLPAAGAPSASVDVDLAGLLGLVRGRRGATVAVREPRTYDLGTVDDVPLAVTDAVALPGGHVVLSAVAEDAATTYDDGPVVGSALVLLDRDGARTTAPLPRLDGAVVKVEGLALPRTGSPHDLLAVVDADRAGRPSPLLHLRLHDTRLHT